MRVEAKCRFLPLLVIALAVGDLCAQETSKNAGGGTATSTQSTAAADSLSADASDQRPIPAAVSNVVAVDHANDRGDKIDVKWDLSPDDGLDDDAPAVSGYRIERSSDGGQS